MRYVVVGYPVISKTDLEWIQTIRKINDNLYDVVRPHFTFVFPTAKLSSDDLIKHVEQKVKDTLKVSFTLSKATVVKNNINGSYQTFLVPSNGSREMTTLHDVLYTDKLAGELRSDIPYVPHVAVGASTEEEMQELTNSINEQGISITGYVDTLSVASFDGKKVKDIQKIKLK